MEVGMVGWLLLIMFGFKHRNTCLRLLNFNFETLKIIKNGYWNFPHLPGLLWPSNNRQKNISCYFLILLFPLYTPRHLYVGALFFHTFHLWVTFSLLAVATTVFSGCCRKQVIILLIFRINKTMGSFSPSTWETVAKLLVYF